MKTVCITITKEVEDNVTYDDLENVLPELDGVFRKNNWQIEDLQIL